jgi:hypothetical protein
MFRSPQSILFDIWNQVVYLVNKEAGDSDQTCDTDGQEAETDLTEIETVDRRINKWKHFEE